MFGFGKKYNKEADILGKILHEQIFSAMQENESLASRRLQTPFFAGYFFGFVKVGLTNSLNVPAGKTKDYYEYICDGIYPKTLYKTITELVNFTQNTREISEADYIKGTKVGFYDGTNFINWSEPSKRANLKPYLLDKKLDYEETLEEE